MKQLMEQPEERLSSGGAAEVLRTTGEALQDG